MIIAIFFQLYQDNFLLIMLLSLTSVFQIASLHLIFEISFSLMFDSAFLHEILVNIATQVNSDAQTENPVSTTEKRLLDDNDTVVVIQYSAGKTKKM